ncbi:hypothetical protein [uncultured Selenomonas sp.]|uniref:hypothetical protein n=1 Tax=uncultured Selenomonas sp. TaxID=159275 RepID=UPI0028ECE7D4|nr:hypothetical protein [uncultured Selenomonas sp.]
MDKLTQNERKLYSLAFLYALKVESREFAVVSREILEKITSFESWELEEMIDAIDRQWKQFRTRPPYLGEPYIHNEKHLFFVYDLLDELTRRDGIPRTFGQ